MQVMSVSLIDIAHSMLSVNLRKTDFLGPFQLRISNRLESKKHQLDTGLEESRQYLQQNKLFFPVTFWGKELRLQMMLFQEMFLFWYWRLKLNNEASETLTQIDWQSTDLGMTHNGHFKLYLWKQEEVDIYITNMTFE